jgi:hypothetical protein
MIALNLQKGADKGLAGRLYFHDEPKTTKQIIFSVKAGGTRVPHVRDLRGVIEREKVQMGVLISMERPHAGDALRGSLSRILRSAVGQQVSHAETAHHGRTAGGKDRRVLA